MAAPEGPSGEALLEEPPGAQASSAKAALLGIAQIVGLPDSPVIIVSDAQNRNAAQAAYGAFTFAALDEGAEALSTDFSPLAGRVVTVLPRANPGGWRRAQGIGEALLAAGARACIVDTMPEPEDWDVIRTVEGGWSEAQFAEFVRMRAKPLLRIVGAAQQRASAAQKKGRPHRGAAPLEVGTSADAVPIWRGFALECNSAGEPHAHLANALAIIEKHPISANRIWLDLFRRKIMQHTPEGPVPWTDADDLRLTAFIQQNLHLPKFMLHTVVNAVQLTAANHPHNSVTDYLGCLTWDGIERLSMWLTDFLGAPNTAYQQALGRNWLISMAARAYQPGCQADHMPVLEGATGRGKSSALRIIGGEWYKAAPQAFGSKEFFEVIQGAWLVEIPDMVGFMRREHSQIISAITTRSDSYRASYGRHAEEHPRTVIFAATSETDEYLQDNRGIRRYWPVRCSEINLAALAAARDQLFAEATRAFKAGATWHQMPYDLTAAEQLERQESDPWQSRMTSYLERKGETSVRDIAEFCLDIKSAQQDRSMQMRIAKCLKMLGFAPKVERSGGSIIRVYRRSSEPAMQPELPMT